MREDDWLERALYGDLPVIGTLKDCERTKEGWRGTDENGIVHLVTLRPGTKGIATMPENNRIIVVDEQGRRIGIRTIERKAKKRGRRATRD